MTNLTDLSLACGFYDLSHMGKMFRKVIGISPADMPRRSGPSRVAGAREAVRRARGKKVSEGPIVSRGALVLEVEPPMKPGTPQRLAAASDTEFAAFYRLYHQTMMRAIRGSSAGRTWPTTFCRRRR